MQSILEAIGLIFTILILVLLIGRFFVEDKNLRDRLLAMAPYPMVLAIVAYLAALVVGWTT